MDKEWCCDNLDLATKHQHILKVRSEHTWQEKLKIERLQIKALLAQLMLFILCFGTVYSIISPGAVPISCSYLTHEKK